MCERDSLGTQYKLAGIAAIYTPKSKLFRGPVALNQWREIGTRKNAGEMHNLNTKHTIYKGNRGERVRFFYSDRHLLTNRQPLRHGKAVILQHE